MPTAPFNDDKELFRRIAADDEQAFTIFFHKYKSPLFDYAMRVTKTRQGAEELVQDCFLRIWTKKESLISVENPKSYLFMMARNAGIDFLRTLSLDQRLQAAILEKASAATPVSTIEQVQAGEASRIINEAVALLPGQQLEVFRLSRYEGLNYEEIGERLGISKNTVKNHLVRALKTIREYLLKNYGPVVVLIIMSFFD